MEKYIIITVYEICDNREGEMMKPQTFGRSYDAGKIVPVQCVEHDTLKDLEIKNECFLLIIVYEGSAHF